MLERAQAEYEEEKRIEEIRHAPVVVLQPWSILEDEYILNFSRKDITKSRKYSTRFRGRQ